jgi:hypothetical protein
MIDEARCTDKQLGLVKTPLSGVFSIEKASKDRQGLQQVVDRVVAIIQAGPRKDRIITRWLKRHQGVEGTLRKQIVLKFGGLPTWADVRLEQASDAQLDTLVAKILTANSLDELFDD